MKSRSHASVACCAAVLIMTLPSMARAASNTLVLTDAEPQYASKLCWASADVLAVNQFYPHCPIPPSPPTETPVFPTSQGSEAGYHRFVTSGLANPPLSQVRSYCEGSIQECNDWGTPSLFGLTFKGGINGGTGPMGLDWDTMRQQIDAGRPVLFVWDYASDYSPDDINSSPVGNHELVVIGYSDNTGVQQLQIWDPWPVPAGDELPSKVPACGPASGVQVTPDHSRPIPFSTYSTPVNDMGVPVTAVHDQDQWDLARIIIPEPPHLTIDSAKPIPPRPSPPLPFLKPQPPGPLQQLSFVRALSMALPQSRKLDLHVANGAPRTLGVPFPIVGLGFQQLLGAVDEPTRLLAGTTSVILFPVESRGEVVDAFLMLFTERRWQRGGYANIEITRRLVDVRARYAAKLHLPLNSFYMVSVPGEVAFFAAHGKGKQAILIPASTDPTIDAVAGKPVLADKQLRKLTAAIQLDLQRHSGPNLDTVRPR